MRKLFVFTNISLDGYFEGPGGNIIMFGSNTLCVNLMEVELIDEFQILVNPVAFGAGTSLFAGLSQRIPLKLAGMRQFISGTMMLICTP